MNIIKIAQAGIALGLLVAGAAYSANAYAVISCGGAISFAGDNVCDNRASVSGSNQATANATVQVYMYPNKGTSYAGVQGMDSTNHAIAGCKAETTTAGTTVSDSTGCSTAMSLYYVVQHF